MIQAVNTAQNDCVHKLDAYSRAADPECQDLRAKPVREPEYAPPSGLKRSGAVDTRRSYIPVYLHVFKLIFLLGLCRIQKWHGQTDRVSQLVSENSLFDVMRNVWGEMHKGNAFREVRNLRLHQSCWTHVCCCRVCERHCSSSFILRSLVSLIGRWILPRVKAFVKRNAAHKGKLSLTANWALALT